MATLQDLNNVKMELELVKADLQEVKKTIQALQDKRIDLEKSTEGVIKQEKQRMQEEVLQKCSLDLDNKLKKYEKDISDLRAEKAKKMEEFSLENIKKNILSDSPLSEETRNLIIKIKKDAEDSISKRFVSAYLSGYEEYKVSESEFLEALDILPTLEKSFSSNKKSTAIVVFDFIIEFINHLGDKEDIKERSIFIAVGIGTVILFFIAFPIFIVILFLFFSIALWKSFLLKKSLDILKVIEDNFYLMEKALDKRSYEQYQQLQKETEKEYEISISDAQKNIDTLMEEITIARQNAIATFQFDDTSIRNELDNSLEKINFSILEQQKLEKSLTKKILNLNKQIQFLEQDYKDSVQKIVDKYIGFHIGTSVFYPEKFLLTSEEPLKYFLTSKFSNFFIYKEELDAINLVKLFCYQLRSLLSPSLAQIQIWDIKNSGISFMPFKNPNPKGESGGFEVHNNTESIKEALNALSATFQKRLQVIRVSYSDIVQYNKDMVTLNSVPENYHIVFCLSSDLFLSKEEYMRLLVGGAELGIYIYVFCDLAKLSEAYFSLLEHVKYCYVMQNGQLISSSKKAIMAQISNKD